jgi:hypothetical protein
MPPKETIPFKQNSILKRYARGMMFCKPEARKYAVCVSSKGMTVEQNDCKKEFQGMLACMARSPAGLR